jgi:SagB-type dehydrogenase family enzyme
MPIYYTVNNNFINVIARTIWYKKEVVMKRKTIGIYGILCMAVLLVFPTSNADQGDDNMTLIELPKPDKTGDMPVETALFKRRSVRDFVDYTISLKDISQLLWAGQGITGQRGFRTAPSAGALYPIDLYLVVEKVNGLETGLYKYDPFRHNLIFVTKDKSIKSLPTIQDWAKTTSAVIIITGAYNRTTIKYGQRGIRYVHIEAGSVGQNIYLQSEVLGLGTTYIGAFEDSRTRNYLGVNKDVTPLGILPIGKPR